MGRIPALSCPPALTTPASVIDCFVEAAHHFPERTAVRAGDRSLDYRELDKRSARLARHLMRLGAGAEVRVGLCMPRGIGAVVGMLGILRSGAAYVPLDPDMPATATAAIVADAGLTLMVSERGRATAAGLSQIDLDTEGRCAAPAASLARLPSLDPRQLMYAIYTSGSTGGPKGVMVEHGQVARLFPAIAEHVRFDECDVWTQMHSLAFGFSVWEIWGALGHGGTLLVVPPESALAPSQLFAQLALHGATVLSLTPSAFRVLVRSGRALPAPATLPSLRLLAFSGEPLDAAILQAWFDRFGDERPVLANMYALTETAGEVAYRRVRRADTASSGRHSIGRPLLDTAFRLVDAAGAPVQAGETGELIVVGPSVARGYLNRPELQSQRFVVERVGAMVEVRGYCTGDVARQLADGEFEFVGRADRQLKVRGYRVEPGQIEDALRTHDGIVDAVVTGDHHGLRAFVVTHHGRLPGRLREFVAERLPHYYVPDEWVAIDRLPLTANGKLDLEALVSAREGRAAVSDAPTANDTARLADALRAIWCELLGIDDLRDDDDFFDRGGHSLLTLQLILRIEERLGRKLTMRDVFEHPTFAAQAELLQRAERVHGPARAAPALAAAAAGESAPGAGSEADAIYMGRAIAEARRALDAGEAPYAACIVRGGEVLACTHNRISGLADVTAHAEVEAIRAACAATGSTDLSGCTIYSTCEPCSMCLTACVWAGIGRVVSGARMDDEQRFGLAAPTVPAATMQAHLGRPAELVPDVGRDEMLELFELWLRMQAV